MFWVWSASPPNLWAENSSIFHHDNAPSHSSPIVTEFLAKHETKVIAQVLHSPDLAPCVFFLFPKLKYPLRGTRHEFSEAIKRNSLIFHYNHSSTLKKFPCISLVFLPTTIFSMHPTLLWLINLLIRLIIYYVFLLKCPAVERTFSMQLHIHIHILRSHIWIKI